jgi:hypothetical protein
MGSYCQTIWRQVELIKVHLKRLICLSLFCRIGPFVHAQSYPTKVVKVIVPSETSGTMDLLDREFTLACNTLLGKLGILVPTGTPKEIISLLNQEASMKIRLSQA